MKVLILGAGAVGLSVAAKLSTVCDVHAVCRKKSADAIQDRGFRMTGIWGEGIYRFSASEDVPSAERFDFIVITAKSKDTRHICRQFADIIRNTDTVSLQNGIGNEEIIARYTDRVICGMIVTGFKWRGDAAVHVSVEPGPMRLGRFLQGLDGRITTLVALLTRAGIRVEATDRIRYDLRSKAPYNCALNPLGAITGVPYRKLADPASSQSIEQIVREAFLVVHAEGVLLLWETADGYLAYLQQVQLPATALHHSSMLQDISCGKKTYIDFIIGAVVVNGLEHGIPSLYNQCIVDLIKFRESLSVGGTAP